MEVDLSQLDFATATKVDELLRKDFNEEVVRAAARQRQIAAINHLHRPRARDGFGERTFQLDAVFDAYWRAQYGHNYTENKDLMKFLLKRNPEIGVKSLGTKIQVGYAAGRNSKRPVGMANAEVRVSNGKVRNYSGSGVSPLVPNRGETPLPLS